VGGAGEVEVGLLVMGGGDGGGGWGMDKRSCNVGTFQVDV